jgi:hypothetical protein
VKDETPEDAAVLGVVLPADHGESDDFEVWEENWPALEMFMRAQTQWRVGMNGITGLDYGAVAWLLKLYEVEDQRSLLEDLQVMEGAVLAVIAKREG